MNLREFIKRMVGPQGKADPGLARHILETLKAVAIADRPEVKRALFRRGNTAAMGSASRVARRRAARRRQKASRAAQRRAGTYGRAQ